LIDIIPTLVDNPVFNIPENGRDPNRDPGEFVKRIYYTFDTLLPGISHFDWDPEIGISVKSYDSSSSSFLRGSVSILLATVTSFLMLYG
jgi:hypothetical protein